MTSNQFRTGDIIVNGSSKRKVLATLENLVFLSWESDFEKAGDYWLTHQELTDSNWSVEQKDWKPELGERYWYIEDGGRIFDAIWEIHTWDKFRLVTHNCFRTREEAERHRENMLKK